jgi:hypothetical protein
MLVPLKTIWRMKFLFLSDQWITEEIREEIKLFPESN